MGRPGRRVRVVFEAEPPPSPPLDAAAERLAPCEAFAARVPLLLLEPVTLQDLAAFGARRGGGAARAHPLEEHPAYLAPTLASAARRAARVAYFFSPFLAFRIGWV